MKSVNEQLDKLFCEWMQEAEKHGDCNFVCDGMVNGFNDWAGREMRIAFVGKDPHFKNMKNLDAGVLNGEDYRAYDIQELSTGERFWRNILSWANGIAGSTDIPFAFVNIKKEAGSASVSNGTLKKYARRYQSYLKRQLLEIIRPNVIVCCGTSGIVMDEIYNDIEFQRMDADGFVWYNQTKNLLLIATHHPTNRMSNEKMLSDTIGAYKSFINRKQLNL